MTGLAELEIYILLPILVGICIITFFIGWFLHSRSSKSKIANAESISKKILSDAELKSKETLGEASRRAKLFREDAEKTAQNLKKEKLLEVKDEFYKRKQRFDEEVKIREKDVVETEKKLQNAQESIEKIKDELETKNKNLKETETEIKTKIKELTEQQEKIDLIENEKLQNLDEAKLKLQRISGLSNEEAKKILFDELKDEVKLDCAQKLQEIRDEAKQEANKISRNIVVQGIQRSASDHSVETTVSVLQIQSDELKGRIIGKEGRNIRAFEAMTGVDIIVDDTPEAVIISGFDPFRREVARVAMERLIADGRIHPARIE
jgi:ribonuclease Y